MSREASNRMIAETGTARRVVGEANRGRTCESKFIPVDLKMIRNAFSGEVAEWSKAAVLKTAVPSGTGGSNPFLSAEGILW